MTTDVDMLESEISDLIDSNTELCSAIKALYALNGEDEQVAKICNEVLQKHDSLR